jgi:hypothetical protein
MACYICGDPHSVYRLIPGVGWIDRCAACENKVHLRWTLNNGATLAALSAEEKAREGRRREAGTRNWCARSSPIDRE